MHWTPVVRHGKDLIMNRDPSLPIVVIGAGPVGLVAAAQLIQRGETPIVLEAGETAASHIRDWGHVRLFSPWKYLIDETSSTLLTESGWISPDRETLPLGRDLVEEYLEPLAAHPAMAPVIRYGMRVQSVTRRGLDKLKDSGRHNAPFEVITRDISGRTERILARAVIDASGSYGSPNPIGAGGLPAEGEIEHSDAVHYGIPDVLGRHRSRYSGRSVLVVGSGHSAFNSIQSLEALRAGGSGTRVTWAVRRNQLDEKLFGGGRADQLSARGSLGTRMKALVDAGLDVRTGFYLEKVAREPHGLAAIGRSGERIGPIDEIIATTGYRPNLEMTRELRLDLDPAVEAPRVLAPLIDPNIHDCGTVPPHGHRELAHPEAGFYTVGMKSYGRAPTFLMLTGYEQVRSVVSQLTGDTAAADDVRLVLPETGVCATDSCELPVA
jgi:thioredoxin reductase